LASRLAQHIVVPICPEQLGGLPTPRPPAQIVGGDGLDVVEGRAKVMTKADDKDATMAFILGAESALQIAKLVQPELCILKAKSPSCGLTPILGVTTALLLSHGYNLMEIE